MGDAYFGFYLLAMGSGRARTAAQLVGAAARGRLRRQVRELPTPLPLQVGVLWRAPGRARPRPPAATCVGLDPARKV
jgi:hypothetical protein